MKKGTEIEILHYYYNKEHVGKKGIVINTYHDKDCIYAQNKYVRVKFKDNSTLTLPTCFIREV